MNTKYGIDSFDLTVLVALVITIVALVVLAVIKGN